MIILKILTGVIFNLMGILVLYKGIKTTRLKGIGESFIGIIAGIGFIFIGLLVWTGYIS